MKDKITKITPALLMGLFASMTWANEANTLRLYNKNNTTTDVTLSSVDSVQFKSTVSIGQTLTVIDLYKSGSIFKSQNIAEIDSILLIQYSASNRLCLSDSFTDYRDGQIYSCKKIGSQTWMGQNLNYENTSESLCYADSSKNCTTNGRLYSQSSAYKSCPEDWHLPYSSEWDVLANFAGGKSVAGTKLLSLNSGGTDDYGFGAKLSGSRGSFDGKYDYLGINTSFWTNSFKDSYNAYKVLLRKDIAALNVDFNSLSAGFSVRCVQDTIVSSTWTTTPEGLYKTQQTISLKNGTLWTKIYYTLDGSDPTTQSNLYTGPFLLNQGLTTLKAIAVKSGLKNSPILTKIYNITGTVATPTFSIPSGFLEAGQNLVVSSATPGATFYYTLDGSTPTTSSPILGSSLALNKTTKIRVFAYKKDWNNSRDTSAKYTIGTQITDSRDNQKYWTVPVGSQTWMSENLRYYPAGSDLKGSWCIDAKDTTSCQKYGRIYNWNVALQLPVKCQDSTCVDLITPKHQGQCPAGWHIPTKADMDTLTYYKYDLDFGFAPILGGCIQGYQNTSTSPQTGCADAWTTESIYSSILGWNRARGLSQNSLIKDGAYNLRCVKD
jgi:uncharacterized protein (TIGR02145 family)